MLLELQKQRSLLDRNAERILALVLRYSLGHVEPQELHLAKIRRASELDQPLELVLPAFPAKSANREKTHGHLPDYAEVLGLERLQETCSAIRAIHAPGARVLICSDGRVFSDLVLVEEMHVTAYNSSIEEIAEEMGFMDLRILGLENVFGSASFEGLREKLVTDFGRPVEEIRAETLSCLSARAMFNGIHRFLFEDRAALEPTKSRNRVREESKHVAYQVIQRSNAWSALVEKLFPHALRLSIHPQAPTSAKIGFQLVPCENMWGTPWHNVALLGASGFRLVKRKQALDAGATLAFARGKYAFYREAGQ
jgi:pyoverdine/dityrosine biosynthesis protein Dit1